jgi:hypothetical protein
VAGALAVPRDAQLYCYYCRSAPPQRVEVYEVDDLFYTRYAYGLPPSGVPQVDDIAYWHDPLLPDQLREKVTLDPHATDRAHPDRSRL